MRRAMLVIVSVVAAGAIQQAPIAGAHDHRVPVVMVAAGGLRKEASAKEVWWVDRAPDGCVSSNSVGPDDFPAPIQLQGPGYLRLRFNKKQKPVDVSINVRRGLRVGDQLVLTRPEPVDVTALRRVRTRGRTRAWEAILHRPGPGEHYFQALAQWRDVQGCDETQGGYWRFSVSVGP